MATCGSCKSEGMSVTHVKECYAAKRAVAVAEPVVLDSFSESYVQSRDFTPMALDVPDSKYALVREGSADDQIVFYEVRTGRNGKWVGFQFLDRLVGAPGDWRRTPVKGQAKKNIIAEIAVSPKAAAARYGKEFTVCGVCNSPLSDPESMAAGLGPICAKRF